MAVSFSEGTWPWTIEMWPGLAAPVRPGAGHADCADHADQDIMPCTSGQTMLIRQIGTHHAVHIRSDHACQTMQAMHIRSDHADQGRRSFSLIRCNVSGVG
mmetsp:Transcript_21238/g.36181  ORF Transcript_21238/g.36181 Transcript_21238/m.36181 type:complete len:101 (+) Transcript_21238:555-857(+)